MGTAHGKRKRRTPTRGERIEQRGLRLFAAGFAGNIIGGVVTGMAHAPGPVIFAVLIAAFAMTLTGLGLQHAGARIFERFPVQHAGTWAMGVLMLAAIAGLTAIFLPGIVNGSAYLLGAERQATFHPARHAEACSKSGCSTVTDGYVSGSGATMTLTRDVPLGVPVQVRVPLWNWGLGKNSINSTSEADAALVAGFFFADVTVFFVSSMIMFNRGRRGRALPLGE